MRKINLIFQEVIKFFLIFLLSFIWLRYFLKNLLLSIFISLCVATSFYLLLFFLGKRKKKRASLKIKEKEDAENIFLSLACDNKKMEFFQNLALKKHNKVEKFSKYIIIFHENGSKTLLFPDFKFETLSLSNFMEIYKVVKNKAKKVVILCYSYEKEIKVFAERFEINFLIFDRFEAYEKLYKFYDYFPKIEEKLKKDKILSFKDFIAFSFNKKRAKGYLLSALLLAISAIFVRTTVYYTIVATILVVFAIISQFNTTFNFKNEKEVL